MGVRTSACVWGSVWMPPRTYFGRVCPARGRTSPQGSGLCGSQIRLHRNDQSSLHLQLFLHFVKTRSHSIQPKVPQATEEGCLGVENGMAVQTGPSLGKGWPVPVLGAFAIGCSTVSSWGAQALSSLGGLSVQGF